MITAYKTLEKAGHKKIIILGCPGSGKTTFARKLSNSLGLPLIKMDDLYWEPFWKRPDEESFINKLESNLKQDQWIIDGNYYKYLEQRLSHADAIIFLDFSTVTCLWRAFKRFCARRWGETHSLPKNIIHSSPHVFQPSVAAKLVINILFFSASTKPKMLQLIGEYDIPIYFFNEL